MKNLQISSNLDNLHLHCYWCCQTNCCHCWASQHEGKCRIKKKKRKKTLEQSEVSFFYLIILTSIIRKEKKEKKLNSTAKQILPHLHFYNAVIRYEDYGTWIHQTYTKMTSDRESFLPCCCYRWQMTVLPRDEQQQFIKSSPVVMAARLLPRSSGYSFWKTKEKNHTKCPLGSWLRNTTKETITQCRTRLSFCYLPLTARQWGHVSHPQIHKPQRKDSTNDPKVNKDLAGVTLFY